MIIDLYSISNEYPSQAIGSVVYENGRLSADGAGVTLLDSPLQCFDPQRGRYDIDPRTHPEEFVRALPTVYRGSYLRAVARE